MAFQPGVSGNPGGRPAGLRALLKQKYGDQPTKLVEGVEKIAFSKAKNIPAKTRLEAYKLLLAYHSGPPLQKVQFEDEDGKPIGPITVVIKGRTAA